MLLFMLINIHILASWSLSLEDVVVAMPTSTARHPLMLSTRSWRSSMRSVITTNDTQAAEIFIQSNLAMLPIRQEIILGYPDEMFTGDLRHAPRGGDVRSALTPFLAHDFFLKSAHIYKWLLYGGIMIGA